MEAIAPTSDANHGQATTTPSYQSRGVDSYQSPLYVESECHCSQRDHNLDDGPDYIWGIRRPSRPGQVPQEGEHEQEGNEDGQTTGGIDRGAFGASVV